MANATISPIELVGRYPAGDADAFEQLVESKRQEARNLRKVHGDCIPESFWQDGVALIGDSLIATKDLNKYDKIVIELPKIESKLDPETEKLLEKMPPVHVWEVTTGIGGWSKVRVGEHEMTITHTFPFFAWRRDWAIRRMIRRYFSNLHARLSYQEPEKEDPDGLKIALERCRRDWDRDVRSQERIERQKNSTLLKAAANA